MATKDLTIHDLFPILTSEQQVQATESLGRYVALICRIYERSNNLTDMDQHATI